MKDIQQLIKKNNQEGRYSNIFPKSYTEAIQSRETGEFLDVTLQKTNFLFLSYNGSEEDTRLQVPYSMRRKGLWISYVTFEGSIISNFYNGEGIGDAQWKDSNNWISGGIGDIQEIINDIKDWVNSYISDLISTAVTNATKLNPEDLSKNSEGEIQLTDRDSTNGMGYVILRKNKTFAEQVTKKNTIYEIRYDYDLDGGEVTIPANCVLKFNGGCISNGTFSLTNTLLLPLGLSVRDYILEGVSITGNYREGQIVYDSALKKQKLWNGTDWVNLDGTALADTNAIEEIPASQDITY